MRFRTAISALVIFFSVVAAAQDRITVRCESNDEHYKRCPADQVGRVELRRQLSGSPCTQGGTWGYDANGIWVDRGCRAEFDVYLGPSSKVIRCDSSDEFRLCQTGPITGARLQRQISGSPCRETYSWGRRFDGVWVDRGCRAEFEVFPRTAADPPIAARVVRCDSDDERYHFCSTGQIERAELNRQISGTPCRRDYSWGQRGDGIWVDKGCRAEFEVVALRRLIPRTIRCNSEDGGYHLCATGAIERAQVTRQISGSACREGYSWGRRPDGIWVDKGCRAEFEVYSYEDSATSAPASPPVSAPPAASPAPDSTQSVRCESDDGRYRFCGTGVIRSAQLSRRLSDAECKLNYSWGYREDGVWVDRGCRAEFRLLR